MIQACVIELVQKIFEAILLGDLTYLSEIYISVEYSNNKTNMTTEAQL